MLVNIHLPFPLSEPSPLPSATHIYSSSSLEPFSFSMMESSPSFAITPSPPSQTDTASAQLSAIFPSFNATSSASVSSLETCPNSFSSLHPFLSQFCSTDDMTTWISPSTTFNGLPALSSPTPVCVENFSSYTLDGPIPSTSLESSDVSRATTTPFTSSVFSSSNSLAPSLVISTVTIYSSISTKESSSDLTALFNKVKDVWRSLNQLLSVSPFFRSSASISKTTLAVNHRLELCGSSWVGNQDRYMFQ